MESSTGLPMTMIKDLVGVIDEQMDDAINAHGFSFSALAVDHSGARLCYGQPQAPWRLIIFSSTHGTPGLILERGSEAHPSLRLQLALDSGPVPTLADALGIAMNLFNSLDQS